MNSPLPIVQRWQSSLLETEEALQHGSPRFRWVRQMYLRLYRFLLSQYGHQPWRGGDATEGGSRIEGRMFQGRTNVVAEPPVPTGGMPPKTADRIRGTLKKVHAANLNQPGPGPLAGGRTKLTWIRLKANENWSRSRRTARLLRRSGIQCQLLRRGREMVIQVRLEDCERARMLIQERAAYLAYGYPPLLLRSRSGRLRSRTEKPMDRLWFTLTVVFVLYGVPFIAAMCGAGMPTIFGLFLLGTATVAYFVVWSVVKRL